MTIQPNTNGESLNLYLISQKENLDYDTYDSAVVCCENEEEARMTHPSEYIKNWDGRVGQYDSWCDAKYVDVQLIGKAHNLTEGVVCSSFNAG